MTDLTRPECAARLQRWLDGDQTYVPEDAIAAAVAYLREPAAPAVGGENRTALIGAVSQDTPTGDAGDRVSRLQRENEEMSRTISEIKAVIAPHCNAAQPGSIVYQIEAAIYGD